MQEETSKCPWCGNIVPQAKFIEIENRIRDEEKKKLALVEANLRRQYEEENKLTVERALKKAVEAERKAADGRAKEQARKLETERDSALKKAKALEEGAAKLRKQVTDEAEKKLKERLAKDREILERDHEQKEKKLKAEFARDQEKTRNKVAALERKLQKKTANELGDGAEIDLYEELRSLFEGDHITRVRKGEPGADIHHEVYHKGTSCGKIVYDSKNRQNWMDGYASKLRADQTTARAIHAILSTNCFPSGKKELCIVDDVIAVSPARVGYIVQLLRNSMVRMHILNLSLQERSGKMVELYKLISSETFAQGFREADKLTQDLLNLDVKEVQTHETVWKKRGLTTKRLKKLLTEMQTDISAVVERTESNLPKTSVVVAEFRPSTATLS